MPGRGLGLLSNCDSLRRPGGSVEEIAGCNTFVVEDLVERIAEVTSPDDLAVSTLANEIQTLILEETSLSDLINKLFARGLKQRDLTPVIGAICGLASQHQVNQTKLRSLLFTKLQEEYEKRDELAINDRKQFVTLAMFLGEIFHRFRSSIGCPIEVLALPVVTCLLMVLKPHLTSDAGPEINEEMMAVAKQLLQNGSSLYKFHPRQLEKIVKGVTEILIRHKLSDSCRLNLLATLSDLWPVIHRSLNARTTHATLAAKLGLAFQI